MIAWNNLDTLASYRELQNTTRVDLAAAMTGVRAAVVPIMLSALLGLYKSAFRFPPCVVVAVLSFSLYLFLGVSCVWLVIIGAILMGVINIGMSIMGVDANYQKVVKGLVLLAAVIFDVVSKRKQS